MVDSRGYRQREIDRQRQDWVSVGQFGLGKTDDGEEKKAANATHGFEDSISALESLVTLRRDGKTIPDLPGGRRGVLRAGSAKNHRDSIHLP